MLYGIFWFTYGAHGPFAFKQSSVASRQSSLPGRSSAGAQVASIIAYRLTIKSIAATHPRGHSPSQWCGYILFCWVYYFTENQIDGELCKKFLERRHIPNFELWCSRGSFLVKLVVVLLPRLAPPIAC